MAKSKENPLLGFFVLAAITLGITYFFVGEEKLYIVYNLAWGIIGGATLLSMITLPWNLYFEAKALIEDQSYATDKGKEVKEKDKKDAKKLAKLLLVLCMALHIGTAAGVGIYTYFVPTMMGTVFAAAFLISVMFRPMASFYAYQMERLSVLRGELRFPRDDVHLLKSRVDKLEPQQKDLRHSVESVTSSLNAFKDNINVRVDGVDGRLTDTKQHYDDQIDKICREFERSIERLTEDKELLRGIKAFIRLVKDT
ncbi:MAG: hypothetical protein P1V97_18515 [Planctomycetota bacterium]|nr:hypothetical protein [Planctomycetota bacterium]